MHIIVLALLVSLALLIGCQWYQRIHNHKGISVVSIAIIVGIIDYLIAQYISKYSKIGMLKLLWIRVALALSVPLMLLTSSKIGKGSCLAMALIGTGIFILMFNLLKYPHLHVKE
jgi:uncharacterized protein YqhQ